MFVRKAAALMLSLAFAGSVYAAAPMAKSPAPGYFRMMLGDFEITALNDGTTSLPVDKLLTNIKPEEVAAHLTKAHFTPPVETSFNGFLINTGSKLVMVDSGAGSMFGPTLGKLVANLKASGYQPEQIDEIYITHMHGDHVGGLVKDGQAVFPNAIVRADKAESDYWLNPANAEKVPDNMKGGFKNAATAIGPYQALGHFKPFEGAVELVPGVKSQPTHGHTPGHSTYVVTSKDQKLVLIGDMIHVGAVQFPDPNATLAFDSDQKSAQVERLKLFADAAKQGYLLGAAHISFPGMFYLHSQGKGYEVQPVNFTQMNPTTP
jgi:glyoxylase-like metal-dependent hydrolase (beta-lactamase superfamily II)